MKRLFSLLTMLLCAAMLTTGVSALDADAFAIYQKYVKKSKSVSSMELSVVQKFYVSDGGESTELTKQTAAMKMITTPDNKIQMEINMTDSLSGETSRSYFKDDYLYQKQGNIKQKIKMSMNEALSSTANIDWNLTKEQFKDATVEKVDGGTKITYKTKLSDMKDGKGNPMASLLQEIAISDGIRMSVSTVTTSLIIGDDSMLKSYKNSFAITISDETESMKLRVAQSAKVKSVNTVTKIDFPSDLNTYKAI